MKDLYKAIDSLNSIISEESEMQLDEKLKPYQGSYDKKTQKLVNFTMKNGEVKTFVAPKNYVKPLSKTNPSAKPVINFLNNLGKKISDKGKELDPFYKKPDVSQGSTIAKKQPSKVVKKELPKLKQTQPDQFDKIQGRKKVKATAANTKNYDSTLALQKALIAKGAKIKADGIMGPNTRAAMKKFGQPPATPIARPKTKSGGPDNRFVTGPELDMPMRPMNPAGPPEKRNRLATITGPELDLPNKTTKVKPITTPGPNTYRADAQGNYKKISPNAPKPQSTPGDSLITRIGKGFGKMGKDLAGFGKDVYNFADKYGIASNLERYRQKNQNKNKLASKESAQPKKSMIEQITGKK